MPTLTCYFVPRQLSASMDRSALQAFIFAILTLLSVALATDSLLEDAIYANAPLSSLHPRGLPFTPNPARQDLLLPFANPKPISQQQHIAKSPSHVASIKPSRDGFTLHGARAAHSYGPPYGEHHENPLAVAAHRSPINWPRCVSHFSFVDCNSRAARTTVGIRLTLRWQGWGRQMHHARRVQRVHLRGDEQLEPGEGNPSDQSRQGKELPMP